MNKVKIERMKSQMQPSKQSVEKLLKAIENEPNAKKEHRSFPWGVAIGAAACLCAVTVFAAVIVPVLNSTVSVGAADATAEATPEELYSEPNIDETVMPEVFEYFSSPLKDVELPTGFDLSNTWDENHIKSKKIIPAPKGTEVYPVKDGEVILSNWYYSYGNCVKVLHNGGITIYAHLDTTNVNEGDKVTIDTVIGTVGNSGETSEYGLGYTYYAEGSEEYAAQLEQFNNPIDKINRTINSYICFDADGDGTDEEYYGADKNHSVDAKYVTDELLFTIPEKNIDVYAIEGIDKTVAVAVNAPDISTDVYALYSNQYGIKIDDMTFSEVVKTISDDRFLMEICTYFEKYKGTATQTMVEGGIITSTDYESITDDAVVYNAQELIEKLSAVKAEKLDISSFEITKFHQSLQEDQVYLMINSNAYSLYNITITRSGKIFVEGAVCAVYQADSGLFDSLVNGEYSTKAILSYSTNEVEYNGSVYSFRAAVYPTADEIDLNNVLADNVEVTFRTDYKGAPLHSATATLYPIKDVDTKLAMAAYIKDFDVYVTVVDGDKHYSTYGEVIDAYNLEKYLEISKETQDGKTVDVIKAKEILLSCGSAKYIEDTRTIAPKKYLILNVAANIFNMPSGGGHTIMVDSDGYLWNYGYSTNDKEYLVFIGKEKAAELFACVSE